MDPLSAFSLACGVVQLAGCGLKVISSCRQLHNTGKLEDHTRIEEDASHLQDMYEVLKKSSDGDATENPTPLDKEIFEIARSCSETANELIDELKKLQLANVPRKRDIFKSSLKVMTKKNMLEGIQQRLMDYQRIVDTKILVQMRQGFLHFSTEQTQILQSLHADYRKIENELLQGQTRYDQLSDTIHIEGQATREHFSQEIQDYAKGLREQTPYQLALESLHFPEIHSRQEEISDAHCATFNWVLDGSPDLTRPGSNFAGWLETGHGVYWISGKMGSGKSTLMSYVCQDPRTKSALERWGGPDVMIPSFFFWNAGTPLQKSIKGLLRSLIYQILKIRSDVAPIISHENSSEEWTDRRLKVIFQRIMKSPEMAQSNICFFVDGLDEFDNIQREQESLLGVVRSIIDIPTAKICVSSRPNQIFKKAFESHPMCRLQDLTKSDIHNYIHDRLPLQETEKYLNLAEQEKYLTIIREIELKAEGVFLWVQLAVSDQLQGLETGDGLELLQERVRALPIEIEEAYSSLLRRLDKKYNQWAARVFELILKYSEGRLQQTLSLLDLALMTYDDLDRILLSDSEICLADIILQCQKVERKLHTLIAVFVEVGSFTRQQIPQKMTHLQQGMEIYQNGITKVAISHRSVADFFRRNEHGRSFLAEGGSPDIGPSQSATLKIQIIKARMVGFSPQEKAVRLPPEDIQYLHPSHPSYKRNVLLDVLLPLSPPEDVHQTLPWHPNSLNDLMYLLPEIGAEAADDIGFFLTALDLAMTSLYRQSRNILDSSHWTISADVWCQPRLPCFPNTVAKNMKSDKTATGSRIDLDHRSFNEAEAPIDLLGLASMVGLHVWIEQNVSKWDTPPAASYLEYLVHCATLGLLHVQHEPHKSQKSLKLLAVLLTQASDLAGSFQHQSRDWRTFLFCMFEEQRRTLFAKGAFNTEAWAAAAQKFLAKGHSPEMQVTVTNTSLFFRDIIRPDISSSAATSEGDPSSSDTSEIELRGIEINPNVSAFTVLWICLRKATSFPEIRDICLQGNTQPHLEILGLYMSDPQSGTIQPHRNTGMSTSFQHQSEWHSSGLKPTWTFSDTIPDIAKHRFRQLLALHLGIQDFITP